MWILSFACGWLMVLVYYTTTCGRWMKLVCVVVGAANFIRAYQLFFQ